MKKIVIVASGTKGDVQPAVALSSYLRKKNYDVLICGGLNIRELAEEHDCPFIPVGEDNEKFVARAPDPSQQPIRATKALTNYVINEMKLQFEYLPQIAKDTDLILSVTFGLGGATVAELLNKPYGYIGFCPQILPSDEHPALFVKSHRHSKFTNRLSWVFHKKLFNFSYRAFINENRKRFALAPVSDCWDHVIGNRVLLACDQEYSMVPSDVKQQCYQTGYLSIAQESDMDDRLMTFIDSGAAPIYIGFGSMTASEPGKTTKIVTEAAKLANQRLVLASGWANLGADNLNQHSCYVVGKISHNFLFPKMAAVIHHGGSGTVATAARAGKPQMIVPHMTDQFYFAEQVPKTGVATQSIWRKHLTPQNLAAAIRRLVKDQELKYNSEVLRNKLLNHDSFKLAEKHIREHFMD
ncbi:MAG: glycosyltransferase family 1 protein [Desulfobacterales bacterium]|nr:MAG: glycosyltransferase family 1 protein [Desulfobacterales bacterium]